MEITIPPALEEIQAETFSDCEHLAKVEFSGQSRLKVIGENAFQNSALREFVVPASVKTIAPNAFSGPVAVRLLDPQGTEVNLRLYAYPDSQRE